MEPTTRQIWEEGVKRQRDYRAQLEAAQEKGKKEAFVLVAMNLKEKGMSIEEISRITNLSKEEIKAL